MLKKLLKESFELWVKKRWLKEIDSSVTRYNKHKDKANREKYVMNRLIEEYKKIYNEDLRVGKGANNHGKIDEEMGQ
jgi:hypothetical protein